MADVIWRGGALAVAQVDTLTLGGTIEAGDLFKVTIGQKTLTYTAGTTVAATEAAAMAAAWNALSETLYPEFAEITAAYTSGGSFTLTADEAGVPFTVILSTTESNGAAADAQTFGRTATTANAGPNVWGTPTNWTTGTVPVSTDSVYFEDSSIDCLYDLDQSAVSLTLLRISASYTGKIGLPERNAAGYDEYRETYLKVTATTLDIGRGDGDASARLKINLGTTLSAMTVHKTATGENNLPAALLKGTNAGNTLTAISGSVGFSIFGGEAGTISVLRCENANVRTGPSVTLTTVQHAGTGTLQIESACTTINKEPSSGTMIVLGSGAYTTVNVWGGTLDYQSSGTITTLNVAGTVTFDTNPAGRTVTNANLYKGSTINDAGKSVIWTNGYVLAGCLRGDVTANFGANRTERVT